MLFRNSSLSSASVLLLLGHVLTGAAGTYAKEDGDGSAVCRVLPGTAGWPSGETWNKFNQSSGGKVIRAGAPPGAVCHPGEPTYDADACAVLATAWTTYDFHANDPVSNMWQQYNNDTCLPDPGTPCGPGGYPAYIVNVTTAEDVKLALEFAHEHSVRVVVKSSGHDYQGRSQAPGALSIWVHQMQDMLIHETSFQPKGCSFAIDSPAMTVGGGARVGALYEELDKINRTVVGGGAKSVSVGGYLTGGGHSLLAPRYGLAVDQVLEMEVVTPMGDIVTANECQNEDVFWAMRGGGGSTFGVMTSVTLLTHPSSRLVSGQVGIVTPDLQAPWLWDMIGYVLSQFPYLDANNVSGYASTLTNLTLPDGSGGSVSFAGVGGLFMLQDTQDVQDLVTVFAPIAAHVNATWPNTVFSYDLKPYVSFLDWFNGGRTYVGSRLLDEKTMSNATAVGQAFKAFDGSTGSGRATGSSSYLVAGKGVHNAQPRGGSNALNPIWRRTVTHNVNGHTFPPLDAVARTEALADVNARTEALRQLAPDMGAYVNENNPGEPDWQHAYWGENYERLLQIKRTLDPDDVLWCHPCVGNERWRQDAYQLCRVSDADSPTLEI